jgi:hypothetical protein
MYQKKSVENQNDDFIKFFMPKKLKSALQLQAAERNISLSALLRLISTDYIKHKK